MELNREQLAHGVLTSALFGIGAIVGGALIGATLTGISVNMASTLVQATGAILGSISWSPTTICRKSGCERCAGR